MNDQVRAHSRGAEEDSAVCDKWFPAPLRNRIARCGTIAVLTIDEVQHAVPLAKALIAGGVDVMEVTLRTDAAIQAVADINSQVSEMLVGVGTILTPQQVRDVVEAGAPFGVAPGTNRRVIEQAHASELPFCPGIATPSDLETAIELDCRVMKFFPAEPSGGINYLKALAAPYAHLGVQFIPLGGLTLDNMEPYLRLPSVLAIGGSWLAPRETIRRADWATVTQACLAAREVICRRRGAKQACPAS